MKFGTIMILIIIALVAFYIVDKDKFNNTKDSTFSFVKDKLSTENNTEDDQNLGDNGEPIAQNTPQILGRPECTTDTECEQTYQETYPNRNVFCNTVTGQCELQ